MSEQLKPPSVTYFAVILYPEENYSHHQFLDYVLMRPQYEVAYITHLPESDEKKSHVHCLIHCKDRMRATSFVKYFSPWIDYAEPIHSPNAYLSYMLHDTPQSISEGKIPYSIDDLKGDRKLWKNLVQNSNFVQLEEVLSFYHDFDTPSDILSKAKKQFTEEHYIRFYDFFESNYYMISNMIDQDNKKFERKLKYSKEILL